jgi:hypothetical protein
MIETRTSSSETGILVFSLRNLCILGMADEPQYQSPPPPYFNRAMVKAEGFWFKVAFWDWATESDPIIKKQAARISLFIRIIIIQSRVSGCLHNQFPYRQVTSAHALGSMK